LKGCMTRDKNRQVQLLIAFHKPQDWALDRNRNRSCRKCDCDPASLTDFHPWLTHNARMKHALGRTVLRCLNWTLHQLTAIRRNGPTMAKAASAEMQGEGGATITPSVLRVASRKRSASPLTEFGPKNASAALTWDSAAQNQRTSGQSLEIQATRSVPTLNMQNSPSSRFRRGPGASNQRVSSGALRSPACHLRWFRQRLQQNFARSAKILSCHDLGSSSRAEVGRVP
jgi:hypothetical protein